MQIIIIIIGLLFLLYAIIILKYTFGWKKLTVLYEKSTLEKPLVSVIVAFRNEEKHLVDLLNDLSQQDYPIQQLEIILVNDHSSDQSCKLVKQFINNNPLVNIVLISAPNDKTGKKEALKQALQVTKGELYLYTDADCRLPQTWISTMINYILTEKIDMAIGPIKFYPLRTLFDHLQALEMLSLTAITAGSAGKGNALLVNGANLAITKDAIQRFGYETKTEYSSGDDVFLLHSIKQKGGKIGYVKDIKAMVSTLPQPDLRAFIHQRLRWTGKSKGYQDTRTIYVSIVSFLFVTTILGLFIASFFSFTAFTLFILFMLLKSGVDYFILRKAAKFCKQEFLLTFLFMEEILYLFYVPSIVFSSFVVKPIWKQRKVKV